MTLSRPQPWRARGPAFATRAGSRRRGSLREPQSVSWHDEFGLENTGEVDAALADGDLALEMRLNPPELAGAMLGSTEARAVQALLSLPTGPGSETTRRRSA